MNLKTIQRVMIAGSLVLGASAAGCSDDNGTDMMEGDGGTGGTDGGTTGGNDGGTTGGDDAGTTGDAGETFQCGGEACEDVTLSTGPLSACCLTEDGEQDDENGSICGVVSSVPGAGCIPQVDSDDVVVSEAAGLYFDRDATDDKLELEIEFEDTGECEAPDPENGMYDYRSGALKLSSTGCCTEDGKMGVNLGSPMFYPGGDGAITDTKFGCISFEILAAAGGGAEDNEEPCKDEKDEIDAVAAGPMARNRNMIPYCDAATGDYACPATLGVVCDGLKANFATFECDADTETPDWVCDRFDAPKDGEQVEATVLTGVPAWVGGCGQETEAENCVPNVSATAFGDVQPEEGNTVPGLPMALCGCGEGEFPANDPIECIPNTIEGACGMEPNPT